MDRLHLVLEVGSDNADPYRLERGLAWIAVAGLEVGRHGEVGGGDDAADRLDHELHGDVLAVGISVCGGDRMARGGEGGDAIDLGHDAGADGVPHVDDLEECRVGMQLEEGLGPS